MTHEAKDKQNAFIENSVIIDVREPKEFRDRRMPGAINLPYSKFSMQQYEPYKNGMICLVCETGSRATRVLDKLVDAGFENVYLLERQMAHYHHEAAQNFTTKGWSVDRQFRMLLGLLLAIFLIGTYMFNLSGFVAIPIILATGLIFTSIIDRCYLRMGIAMLPWNRDKKG